MRAFFAAAAGIVFLVVAILYSSNPQSFAKTPQFGWKKKSEIAFTLGIGESRAWTYDGAPGKFRLLLRSDANVSFSASNSANDCRAVGVTVATLECELDTPRTNAAVSDARTPGALIESAVGIYTRSATMAQAASRNRVTVELFAWDCIADCPAR